MLDVVIGSSEVYTCSISISSLTKDCSEATDAIAMHNAAASAFRWCTVWGV